MLRLVRSHEAGHGAGYVTVWTRHVIHVTNVTLVTHGTNVTHGTYGTHLTHGARMYLYSSNHLYVVSINNVNGVSRGVSRLSGTREHVTNVTCSD